MTYPSSTEAKKLPAPKVKGLSGPPKRGWKIFLRSRNTGARKPGLRMQHPATFPSLQASKCARSISAADRCAGFAGGLAQGPSFPRLLLHCRRHQFTSTRVCLACRQTRCTLRLRRISTLPPCTGTSVATPAGLKSAGCACPRIAYCPPLIGPTAPRRSRHLWGSGHQPIRANPSGSRGSASVRGAPSPLIVAWHVSRCPSLF